VGTCNLELNIVNITINNIASTVHLQLHSEACDGGDATSLTLIGLPQPREQPNVANDASAIVAAAAAGGGGTYLPSSQSISAHLQHHPFCCDHHQQQWQEDVQWLQTLQQPHMLHWCEN